MNKLLMSVVVSLMLLGVSASQAQPATAVAPQKVLRYGFRSAETGFDPAQISDLYSRGVTANVFDALYRYDYLARPLKVRPNLAADLPQISADFKTFTIKLRPGIYFADDPAFGGKQRELTAQDVVFSYKRPFDPKLKSASMSDLEEDRIIGLDELRAEAQKPGGKFNIDKEIEGVRALGRYTVQFRLAEPSPRFIYHLADASIYAIMAREVVERYGDKIMEHPVGTGPFKLDQWTRSFRIVLVRNPNYREEYYDEQPDADDAEGQALLRRFKGRRLPMVDRIEITVIEEQQPRWLAFYGKEHDLIERVSEQYANQIAPNNQLAPNLKKAGIQLSRVPATDVTMTYFNMQDPIVGGYTPDKVALRRALILAHNAGEEIRLPRRNQAIHAQSGIQPGLYGYDPTLKTEMSEYNPAKAMALLDMFGYVDRNGDGWRGMPDGSPLVLEYHIPPDSFYRELSQIWKKNMDAIGVKIVFKSNQWAEQLKASRAGKMMIWGLGFTGSTPDGGNALQFGYGPQKGEMNLAFFQNAEFDRLYNLQKALPDGPERLKVLREATKIILAYAPYRFTVHRIITDMAHPWCLGYRRSPIGQDFWRYIDIDTDKQPKS